MSENDLISKIKKNNLKRKNIFCKKKMKLLNQKERISTLSKCKFVLKWLVVLPKSYRKINLLLNKFFFCKSINLWDHENQANHCQRPFL